ncbi:MAG: fimbrillin family protein, partial [Allobaculum sp.]|nr:fimbrillin family protein [Allobaculum sp.]
GAAVLMLATACSNDEVVKVAENSVAIGFSSFVNNSTRAVDNDATTLNDLQVWGVSYRGVDGTEVSPYAVFGGDKVTKGTPNWTYENTRYWVAGNSYAFAAVAPANASGVVVTPVNAVTGAISSIDFTNNGKVDLLYDAVNVEAQESAAGYEVVAFNLRHILSRVRFEFKNELAEGYSIKVSALNITNAKTKATFNGEEWNVEDATGTVGFDFDDETVADPKYLDKAAANESAKSQPSYLFPASEDPEYALTFKVELILEDAVTGDPVSIDTYTHTVTLPAQEFKLGYSYAFKTVINADNVDPDEVKYPIEFTAEVEDWIDDTKTEAEIQFPKD